MKAVSAGLRSRNLELERKQAIENSDFLLVDNHPAILAGLAGLVESVGGSPRAINTKNLLLDEAFSKVEEQIAKIPSSRYPVMLLDFNHDEFKGPDLARLVQAKYPRVAIFSLSMTEPSLVTQAYAETSIAGYCDKTESPDKIFEIVGKFLVSDRKH